LFSLLVLLCFTSSHSQWPSNTFYEGTLQNGVAINERLLKNLKFPWPVPEKPMIFYNCVGYEEISARYVIDGESERALGFIVRLDVLT
jgi:regulator of nonsense transcripts 1